MIFTSSDKAVNPTNVMGASKMMGERLVIAANEIKGMKRTKFAAVRFGNVIGSRGSVVPIFAGQILRGEPLTLTHDQMTRYIMSINDAADLVLDAGHRMLGGEVFVTKMRALKVVDLAAAMAEVLGKPFDIVKTGMRPGEKLYEELICGDEAARTFDIDRMLVVLPSEDTNDTMALELRKHYAGRPQTTQEWNSSTDVLMSKEEIRRYIVDEKILEPFLVPGRAL